MKLKALTPLKFGGKRIAEGDSFEAEGKEASKLIADKLAEQVKGRAASDKDDDKKDDGKQENGQGAQP
jgi:hypothetical protein